MRACSNVTSSISRSIDRTSERTSSGVVAGLVKRAIVFEGVDGEGRLEAPPGIFGELYYSRFGSRRAQDAVS